MSSDLYETTSIRGMCQVVQQWPSHAFPVSERQRRRKVIERDIQAIVALPERLNTESCVEIIYVASSIVPLVTLDCWNEYYFVFRLASSQLANSLRTSDDVSRWLEFHCGGNTMVEEELLKLITLLRDAHVLVPQRDVTLCRALVSTLIATLLPTTCSWQSCDAANVWWNRAAALLPAPGGIFTLMWSLLKECETAAQYSRRSLLSSKLDQEEAYSTNSILRGWLVRVFSSFFAHPSSAGSHHVGCLDLLVSVVFEPHFKQREFTTAVSALQALHRCVGEDASSVERLSTLLRRCTILLHAGDVSVISSPPHRDSLKQSWIDRGHGDAFPFWSPAAIDSLLSMAALLCVRNQADVAAEFLGAASSVVNPIVFDGPFCDFIRCRRRAVRILLEGDNSMLAQQFVLVCVRHVNFTLNLRMDANTLAGIEGLHVLLHCMQAILAQRALHDSSQQPNLIWVGATVKNSLKSLQHSFMDCGASLTDMVREMLALLRCHLNLLYCDFYCCALHAVHKADLTFCELATFLREVIDLRNIISHSLMASDINGRKHYDAEMMQWKQEAAVVATNLWKFVGRNSVESESFLTMVNTLVVDI